MTGVTGVPPPPPSLTSVTFGPSLKDEREHLAQVSVAIAHSLQKLLCLMPVTVSDQKHREVSQQELAAMIDRAPGTLSRAVRRRYYCAGYPVFEWAKWHPAGNQIECYRVPIQVLRELLPEEEYARYGIFD